MHGKKACSSLKTHLRCVPKREDFFSLKQQNAAIQLLAAVKRPACRSIAAECCLKIAMPVIDATGSLD